jgi:hypothetical protein
MYESLSDSINAIDVKTLEMESKNETVSELGPLVYLSDLSGQPMDKIVNWLVLLLVFVFDPLAISLIMFLNQTSDKNKSDEVKELPKKITNFTEQTVLKEETPITIQESEITSNEEIDIKPEKKIPGETRMTPGGGISYL